MRRAWLVLGALVLGGCYSATSLGRARVVDEGRFEVVLAPEVLTTISEDGLAVPRPAAEVAVRYGATRDVEVGGRLSTVGIALGPRVQLYRSADPGSGVDVALAPAVAWTYADKLSVDTAVLFGINLGEHQLVLSARLAYLMRFGVGGQDAPLSFVLAGGGVGLALRIDRTFTILPEIALMTQLYAEPGFASHVASGAGVQAALGFVFDL